MTRSVARTVLVVSIVTAILASLTACISNDPANAVGWLKGQSGVSGAEVVESTNEELLVTGTTRGELKPGLTDGQIGTLVNAVQAYTDKHRNVTIELGHGDIAFVVGSDADTRSAIKLWHASQKVPKLLSAVSSGGAVSAGVLRADVGPALDQLLGFGVDLQLDAYADVAIANSTTSTAGSLSYVATSDCHPQRVVVAYSVALAARADVGSGQLELCDGLAVTLVKGVSLAATVPALRADLDLAGMTAFPVNVTDQPDDPAQVHTADVTPGDPATLAVLAGLEAPGAPPFGYELDSDGTLTVTDFAAPASSLLAVITAASGAGGLPAIVVQGQDVTIGGTLAQLASLLAEATALASVSPTFGNVQLTATTGQVELNAAAGADPDVATAAAALRASGAVGSRAFVVKYAAFEVDIANGIASVPTAYTGGEIMDRFVAAWNG